MIPDPFPTPSSSFNNIWFADSQVHTDAIAQVDSGNYDTVLFNQFESSEWVNILFFRPNKRDYGVLTTKFDLLEERCYPTKHDIVRSYQTRELAFLYLQRITKPIPASFDSDTHDQVHDRIPSK